MRTLTAPPKSPAVPEVPQKLPAASTITTWAQMTTLLGARRGAVALLAAGSILAGFAESGILAVLAQSAATLANRSSTAPLHLGPVHLSPSLGQLLIVGFLLAILRLLLQVVISVVPAQIAVNMQARLRGDLFAAFMNASWGEQSRDREGHLQELLTNQAQQATQSAVQATTLISTLLTLGVLIATALTVNVVAALGVLVAAAALSAVLRPLAKLGTRHSRAASRALIAFAGGVNETVRVAEETHVFGTEGAQRAHADELIDALRVPLYNMQMLTRLVPGVYQSLLYLLLIGGVAALYASNTPHVAALGTVILLLVRAGSYGQQAQGTFQSLRQTTPFVEHLQDAQRRYANSSPSKGESPLETVETLSFEDVGFTYGRSRPALSAVDFTVVAGEAIGIIGPSGAGKSTLVQLLLGLRPPDPGEYLVNGLPASDFRRKDWRERFAYVPQEPRLLHASVAENIRFFRPIDDAGVERAARLAGIHDDVVSWSAGYDTTVGPRADAISGGQQQRICLARALAANPQVLVLDEPTSALDPGAEMRIQESLVGLKHILTLFIVAHRMSTLDICERIMVIVDGRLDAFDRIAELRATNAYYRSTSASIASDPLGRDAEI